MKYSERESRKFCLEQIASDTPLGARLALGCRLRFGDIHIRDRFIRVPTYELEELYRDLNPGDSQSMPSAALALMPHVPDAEQTFSLDNLTTADRAAIHAHVVEQTGQTWDMLEDAMQELGMTPVALWHSLRLSSNTRVMIAAAALRSVRRLPPDPRLNPTPYAPAPVKVPRTAEERARAAKVPTLPASTVGEYLVAKIANPKRRGSASYDRFEMYEIGLTRRQLLERGLKAADFKYDSEHGYVTWGDTPKEEEGSVDAGTII